MKRLLSTLIIAATTVSAYAQGGASGAPSASTYKEMAVFNQVAGQTRFVGNFVSRPGRCDVTVFETGADNQKLAPAARHVLTIAAGAQSRLDGGPDSALAIACKTRGDEIAVRPDTRPVGAPQGEE